MNVLSLFDGISCGQVALKELGIKPDRYYASEIDSKPIKVTQHNFPNTIQVGDVAKLNGSDFPNIDLLIGGSPCQKFSVMGKQEGFSGGNLVQEYIRLVKEIRPRYFLLENVKMKAEFSNVITKELGVTPVGINSNRYSAQSRERMYWTNAPFSLSFPEKDVKVEDILEPNVTDGIVHDFDKWYIDNRHIFIPVDNHSSANGLICLGGLLEKDKAIPEKIRSSSFRDSSRVYSITGKAPTLKAQTGGLGRNTGLYRVGNVIRRLSRLETERLQTLPEGYTDCVSVSSAQSLIGNGWTVAVIKEILKNV